MAKKKSPAGTPATKALAAAQVPFELHAYEHDPAERHFGDETAAALGVDPHRLYKTLIASCDGTLTVAVVPVAGQLDLKALASVVGAKRAQLAEQAAAERSSGYVAGGISPLGQRTRLPTVVDTSFLSWPTVFVSAGRRGLQVEVAPQAVVDLTSAQVADVAKDA